MVVGVLQNGGMVLYVAAHRRRVVRVDRCWTFLSAAGKNWISLIIPILNTKCLCTSRASISGTSFKKWVVHKKFTVKY